MNKLRANQANMLIQLVGLFSLILKGTAATKSSYDNLKQPQTNWTSEVRLPLPVHEKGFALASSVSCPTTRCYCQLDSRINRYIINCRHQKLAQIPAFTAVNTMFYEITFSMNNHITEIPTNAFRNLKVERIDLLKNSLVSVLPGAFTGVEVYLKELLIEGNGNIPPPYSKISNLVNLRMLRLQKFQQYTIEQNNYFDRFPDLEVLELYSFVSLTSIDGLAFQNKLAKLQRLEIINSHLTNIPVQSLIHLPSLQKLYIKDSQITTIYSKSFEQLHNLTDLDLSYNKIIILENDAFQVIENHLESLALTFNEITPESMKALSGKTWSKLEQLTLSYNTKLGTVPERSFETMPRLQYLNLVQINLRKISKDFFRGLKTLHTLDLSWNKVETIEAEAFEHTPNLYELKLNRQFGQSDLPGDYAMQMSEHAFHGLENSLAVFNLQDTPIVPQQFWKIVRTLTNLQTLKLSKTRLSKIPDFGFVYNTKLQDIELEGNDIVTLTPDSFTGPNESLLRVLLSSNKLSSIRNCIFDKHTNLEAICLAQNPLNCDCDIFWLYKFISRQTAPIGPCFNFDYICATPKQYENQALFAVPLNQTCSSFTPKECVHENLTTTTTHLTDNPVTKITEETEKVTEPTAAATTTTMTKTHNEITLTIAGKTTNSITLAWNIKDKSEVTGFILEHHATADNFVMKENIHRDKFLHTIHNLNPGLFYTMCIVVEINQVRDDKLKACRTAQTESKGTDTDEQSDRMNGDTFDINDDINARNVLIGAILGTVVVVILVVTGLYLVVKYKVQKLKTLRLTLDHLQNNIDRELGRRGGDLGCAKLCTVSNEYIEMEEMKKAKQYHTIGGRHLQRQYGVEPTDVNNDYTIDDIHDYERQENNLEDKDTDNGYSKASKVDLEQRHSAPSRLNAEDLLRSRSAKCASRPLPATPITNQAVGSAGDIRPSKAVNVITTQVSVYENTEKDSVYHELP